MKFRGRLIRHDQQCHKSYRAIFPTPPGSSVHHSRGLAQCAKRRHPDLHDQDRGGMDHTEWKAAREKAKTQQADLEAQMAHIDRGASWPTL